MADEKDTEATRLAPEKFIPEFNRLSVEGPNNDDDDGLVLKPKRKHGKTKMKIRLRKTSSEVSNKKELPKASSEVSNKKEEKKEEKKDETEAIRKWVEAFRPHSYYNPYGAYDYYGGSGHTGQHEYNREFGRDTNRLDAFACRPFEVSYDPKYGESDYGGGHSGQQQSVSTIVLDTDDLPPPDSNVMTQEENIPNIGLGTTENVHAEYTDNGQDKYTKLVHYSDTTEWSNCIIWYGILFGLVFCFYRMI